MTYKSFVKENEDGSKTEEFTITGPGYKITKRVTTYVFDDDDKFDVRPSDMISIKKVNKCDKCKTCKDDSNELDQLIKMLSEDEDDELEELKKNIVHVYSKEDIDGARKFIETDMLKEENLSRVIDFIMKMYKETEE